MGTVPTSSCSTMRWVLVLTCIGRVVPSPVPSPQLEGLKVLLESLSGDDKLGETNGDYQEVPYDTIEKLNGYEERKYPSVKWACTEATYQVEEQEDDVDATEDPDVKIEQKKEMVVFVKQFGGYAMQDSTWLKQAADFSEQLTEDRANEVDLDKFYTAGYDSPMKFWNRRNEVMFLKTDAVDNTHENI